ncbi:KH domain-containing protein [Thermoleophilum album]|uniref:KH domain-containing protein n=1 Tax=Thermoleophilum album TaxID=29539 RepID=UPI000CC3237A|nr:KH domain-containing protein [Thermoleophilum album]MCL6440336.1 KH domain-containing protein [Thermoleophilum sp.]WDT94430.1 KH domain-containing protein [Thermoleophilum album]GBD46395.1 hypothetical protein HRbin41_01221 [bacterium HR41]
MGSLEDFVAFLARSVVTDPDAVEVRSWHDDEEDALVIEIHVAESDAGHVIGRSGRTAEAIRQVVKAAAARRGGRVLVDIVA